MTWHEELELGIAHLTAHDARLAVLIERYPQPIFRPHTDYYRELIESIVGQQLSVKAAATIYRRFIDSFGHVPEPHEILARDDEDMRATGLSFQKARYIKDLARRIDEGSLTFTNFDQLSNEEIINELTAVKGIGEWTAHMFLIFCMGRLNVLPIGDLGIKNAARQLYDLSTQPTPDEVRRIAARYGWAPYESIASWYLWKSLENTPNTP